MKELKQDCFERDFMAGLSELREKVKSGDKEEQKDALVDIIVFGLGGLAILNVNAEEAIEQVITNNETRSIRPGH